MVQLQTQHQLSVVEYVDFSINTNIFDIYCLFVGARQRVGEIAAV